MMRVNERARKSLREGFLHEARLSWLQFHLVRDLGEAESRFPAGLWSRMAGLGKEWEFPILEVALTAGEDGWQEPIPRGADCSEVLGTEALRMTREAVMQEDLPDAGEVYALRIHDSQVTDLTVRLQGGMIPRQRLGALRARDLPFGTPSRLEEEGAIGQMLLLTLVPEGFPGEGMSLSDAEEAVRSLWGPEGEMPALLPPRVGSLLGGKLIEFPLESNHPFPVGSIWVWELETEETRRQEETGVYYDPLLHVLLSRAKAQYCYGTAREQFERGSRGHERLRQQVEAFREATSLQEYEQILQEAPHLTLTHAQAVEAVQLQRASLHASVENYRGYLATLLEETGDASRDFWDHFVEEEGPRMVRQLDYDLSLLSPTRDIMDSVVASIRGQVEIKARKALEAADQGEKKRDHQLQMNLAFMGLAFAIADKMHGEVPKLFRDLSMSPGDWETLGLLLQYGVTGLDLLVVIMLAVVLAWPVRPMVRWLLNRERIG
ncbi:MAG: hypothetical protein AAF191_03560 [Verrucomicrobiota bacterium]